MLFVSLICKVSDSADLSGKLPGSRSEIDSKVGKGGRTCGLGFVVNEGNVPARAVSDRDPRGCSLLPESKLLARRLQSRCMHQCQCEYLSMLQIRRAIWLSLIRSDCLGMTAHVRLSREVQNPVSCRNLVAAA